MYEYSATVLRVVDGDTLHVDIDLGFRFRFETIIRLYGINAPEMKTRRVAPEGVAARQFVIDWLVANATDVMVPATPIHIHGMWPVMLQTRKDRQEKYGRYLGIVVANGSNLNDAMVATGHAVPYMVGPTS